MSFRPPNQIEENEILEKGISMMQTLNSLTERLFESVFICNTSNLISQASENSYQNTWGTYTKCNDCIVKIHFHNL